MMHRCFLGLFNVKRNNCVHLEDLSIIFYLRSYLDKLTLSINIHSGSLIFLKSIFAFFFRANMSRCF